MAKELDNLCILGPLVFPKTRKKNRFAAAYQVSQVIQDVVKWMRGFERRDYPEKLSISKETLLLCFFPTLAGDDLNLNRACDLIQMEMEYRGFRTIKQRFLTFRGPYKK